MEKILAGARDQEDDTALGRKVRQVLVEGGGPEALLAASVSLSSHKGGNYLPLLWKLYKGQRATLFRVVRSLDLRSTTEDRSLVDALGLSDWSESAKLDVGGASYRATHKTASPDFVLSGADGSTVLVAQKPSAWKERLSLEYEGNRYELKPEYAWRRDFVLSREEVGTVGSLRAGGGMGREWTAELPEEFAPEVKLFMMRLVRLLWQRGASSAPGSG